MESFGLDVQRSWAREGAGLGCRRPGGFGGKSAKQNDVGTLWFNIYYNDLICFIGCLSAAVQVH